MLKSLPRVYNMKYGYRRKVPTTAVEYTGCSCDEFELQAIASPAHNKELSVSTAVESTDRIEHHLKSSTLCSPIDGAENSCLRLTWPEFVTKVEPS